VLALWEAEVEALEEVVGVGVEALGLEALEALQPQ